MYLRLDGQTLIRAWPSSLVLFVDRGYSQPGCGEVNLTRRITMRNQKIWLATAGVLAALALTGCSVSQAGSAEPTPTFLALGGFVLDAPDGGTLSAGDACEGMNGYSDIHPGADITVYNSKGDLIGSASLGKGVYGSTGCTFLWAATIPTTGGPYQYEISHRGKLSFTLAEGIHGVSSSLGGN
jgi:hypothetical protein